MSNERVKKSRGSCLVCGAPSVNQEGLCSDCVQYRDRKVERDREEARRRYFDGPDDVWVRRRPPGIQEIWMSDANIHISGGM